MSFLAAELRFVELEGPAAARAAGVSEDRVFAGLLRTWKLVWTRKVDVVTRRDLAGCFGGDGLDALIDALETDFLHRVEEGWKVRGAEKYLRIRESQSASGKAHAGNLKRGTKPGKPPADSRVEPGTASGSGPALSPNTEHRTPNTVEKEAAAAPKPPTVADKPQPPPRKEPEDPFASGEAFWDHFQCWRVARGLVTEKAAHPASLSKFWNEVHLELGADIARLDGAMREYGEDPYWLREKLPFRGFVAQWREKVPAKAVEPPKPMLKPDRALPDTPERREWAAHLQKLVDAGDAYVATQLRNLDAFARRADGVVLLRSPNLFNRDFVEEHFSSLLPPFVLADEVGDPQPEVAA